MAFVIIMPSKQLVARLLIVVSFAVWTCSGLLHISTSSAAMCRRRRTSTPFVLHAASSQQQRSQAAIPAASLGNDMISWAASLVVSASVLLPMTSAPPPVWAATTTGRVFTNDYTDPIDPLCERHIVAASDGKTFHYSGTAVGSKEGDSMKHGCSMEEIKEFGLRDVGFDGLVLSNRKIDSGDNILGEGTWEPANAASTNSGYEDVDGIRWSNGNKWIVKENVSKKVFADLFYVYYGALGLGAAKIIVGTIDRKSDEAKSD